MVVVGDGVNIPRIQTETRPDSARHGSDPAFRTTFNDSKATLRTVPVGVTVRCVATSSAVSTRTVRWTSISNAESA